MAGRTWLKSWLEEKIGWSKGIAVVGKRIVVVDGRREGDGGGEKSSKEFKK